MGCTYFMVRSKIYKNGLSVYKLVPSSTGCDPVVSLREPSDSCKRFNSSAYFIELHHKTQLTLSTKQ